MGTIEDKVLEAKAWYKSKTIIGTLLMILPIVVKMIKPDLALDLQGGADAGFEQLGQIAGQTDAIWATITQSVGIFLTALGLRTANTSIK